MSSPQLLKQIKKSFDWETYVTNNYEYKRASGKNGPEIRICCPACEETGYKCYININHKVFNCYKCDFKTGNYDVYDFVAMTEDITRGQATLRLVMAFKPTSPTESEFFSLLEEDDVEEEPEGLKFITSLPEGATKVLAVDGDEHWEYVKSRGFTPRSLLATNLHCVNKVSCPIFDAEGKYRGDVGNRIIFPVYGPNGKLVSWQARAIDGSQPKYLSCPGSDLSKTVWPYSLPMRSEAVIVEGIIDALAIRTVTDHVSSYAVFSKQISISQIQIFKGWGVKKVTLWFDKKDALPDMVKAVETLKMHFDGVFVLDLSKWPKDKDVGYFLSDPSGAAIIKDTLSMRIDVYDDLEYTRWQHSF